MAFSVEFLPLFPDGAEDPENPERYAIKMELKGSLNLEDTADILLFAKTILKGGVKRLLIDMERLTSIDSSGIGLVFRILKLFKAADGMFALLGVPPKIDEAFDLVNLKAYVSVFYSEEKALERFRKPASPVD